VNVVFVVTLVDDCVPPCHLVEGLPRHEQMLIIRLMVCRVVHNMV
jgi:hypothetical protein